MGGSLTRLMFYNLAGLKPATTKDEFLTWRIDKVYNVFS